MEALKSALEASNALKKPSQGKLVLPVTPLPVT
jgi:hypothetical protein